MNVEKSLPLACVFIGLTIVTHTGYLVYHDRKTAEAEENQRQLAAASHAEAIKLAHAKSAWATATRDLVAQLDLWRLASDSDQLALTDWIWIKAYAFSDVVWKDSRTVRVQGYLYALPAVIKKSSTEDPRRYYSWTRDLTLLDDDTWGSKLRSADFSPANVSKVERNSMFYIRAPKP